MREPPISRKWLNPFGRIFWDGSKWNERPISDRPRLSGSSYDCRMRSRVIEIASTISGKTKIVDDEFYPIWEGRNPLLKVNESTVRPGPPRETHSLYKISDFDVEVGQEARHQRIQGRQTRLPGRLPHADGLVTLICPQEKVWSTRTYSTCLRRTIRCRIPR